MALRQSRNNSSSNMVARINTKLKDSQETDNDQMNKAPKRTALSNDTCAAANASRVVASLGAIVVEKKLPVGAQLRGIGNSEQNDIEHTHTQTFMTDSDALQTNKKPQRILAKTRTQQPL